MAGGFVGVSISFHGMRRFSLLVPLWCLRGSFLDALAFCRSRFLFRRGSLASEILSSSSTGIGHMNGRYRSDVVRVFGVESCGLVVFACGVVDSCALGWVDFPVNLWRYPKLMRLSLMKASVGSLLPCVSLLNSMVLVLLVVVVFSSSMVTHCSSLCSSSFDDEMSMSLSSGFGSSEFRWSISSIQMSNRLPAFGVCVVLCRRVWTRRGRWLMFCSRVVEVLLEFRRKGVPEGGFGCFVGLPGSCFGCWWVVAVELSETDFLVISSVLLCIPRSFDLSFSSRESFGLVQIHMFLLIRSLWWQRISVVHFVKFGENCTFFCSFA